MSMLPQHVVCAGTVAEANAWADHHGIPRRTVAPMTPRSAEPSRVYVHHFVVVRLPGFFDQADEVQRRIERMLQCLERKRPPVPAKE